MKFTKCTNQELNETLYQGTHKSGLRVFVLPKEYSSAYAIFATDFGSVTNRFVPAGETEEIALPDGIAHFLEHKLFEGKEGNAFELYAKTGASANAFTSFNTTAYLFSATSKIEENLDILLSFVQNPYFTEENVQKEQGIIGQEIRMYEDDPGWRVYFNLLGALYNTYPVRTDIAGTVESIAEINKDLLYKCYESFYHPQNMVLFVAGPVTPELVGASVDKNLMDKQPAGEVKKIEQPEAAKVCKKITQQRLSVSIPMFQIGFKDTKPGAEGKPLLKKEIVNHILLELIAGKASKLYQHLYAGGLINENFYVDQTFEKAYGFSIFAGESNEPKKVQEKIVSEIERLQKNGIEEAVYDKVKKVIYGRYLRTFNSTERVGHYFVSNIFKGVSLFEFVDVYNDVTMEDAKQHLAEHFQVKNMALSLVLPQEQE